MARVRMKVVEVREVEVKTAVGRGGLLIGMWQ